MKPATKFNPTKEQISAAEDVFIALALSRVIKPIFENLETELLATGNYHYSEECYTAEWAKRCNYPADRIILDRKDICQMAGLKELNTPEYMGTDCERFYNDLNFLTKDKFVYAENTDCMADNRLRELQRDLIIVTRPIHGLNIDDITMLEDYKKLIELTLNLFSRLVKPTEEKKMKYHDSFIISTKNTDKP